MIFGRESDLESFIRELIAERIADDRLKLSVLEQRKIGDIVICRDGPHPTAFFIEVKFHKANHGCMGFGHRKGGGFQPEILKKQPAYFEQNLRWVIGSETKEREVLFLTSSKIREYVSGGKVEDKYNNIRKRILECEHWKNFKELESELREWLADTAQKKGGSGRAKRGR